MKVYRIIKEKDDERGQPLILASMEDWQDMLGSSEYEEVDDTYTITITEMSEEEYKNLPEWAGF